MRIRITGWVLCLHGLILAPRAHEIPGASAQAAAWLAADVSATPATAAVAPPGNGSRMVASFTPFRPLVRFYYDTTRFYVESDSMPDAALMPTPMVGITAWQQQLPHPVAYFTSTTNPETDPVSLGYGKPNVWSIPLVPVPAANPISLSGNFLRGAVALAANGIAIFNPRNNTGQFSQAIGELDAYGGHCGRADDYHYHIAPVHLQSVLGVDKPVAWALDGYPIYGYTEPDGTARLALDTDGGHDHGSWGYHYHAIGSAATGPQLPYLMNAMHGVVVNYNGQIDPQPTVGTVAPAGTPLAGAAITAFARPAPDHYVLTYTVASVPYTVSYQIDRIAHTVAVLRQSPSGTTSNVFTSAARFSSYPMAPFSLARLPDTGQDLDATATFGEDGDYAIHPPSYTDNGDGTITDLVTGLMWQKTDSGEMTWDAARANPPIGLGGHGDWRLPTAQEAFSILNHNGNPALNSAYFVNHPGGTPGYFWTSDLFYGDNTKVWATNAGGGLGPHPKSSTLSAGGSLRFHARYVRGAKPTVGHNYRNNLDGTISDLDTGLMWTQVPSAALTWPAALAYAEGLTTAGYSDWRLPNVKELQSLVDLPRATAGTSTTVPCINRILFPAVAATAHWSSTSVRSATPSQAWLVDLGVTASASPSRNQQGIVSYEPYSSTYPVLAVRTDSAVPTQIIVEQPVGSVLSDGASTVSFGGSALGAPVVRTFTLRNSGADSLALSSIVVDGAHAGDFQAGSQPAPSLAAGASTSFEVTFTPSAPGVRTAFLHIPSSDASVGAAFDVVLQGQGTVAPPTLGVPVRDPLAPTQLDPAWVAVPAQAAPGATLSSVKLRYQIGAALATNTVFTETMAAAAANPWTGANANHAWTVTNTGGGAGNVKQTTAANHGSGNPCGLEFSKGSATLSDTMATTSDPINAEGASAYVEFWVAAQDMAAANGWTFQVSTNGISWTTRAGETNGTAHAFQPYHVDLAAGERVPALRMRFQFAGNATAVPPPKVSVDDIRLVVATGLPSVVLDLLDDGAHHDGAAGDGVFGAAIPPQAVGAAVRYTVFAVDDLGGQTGSAEQSYTVGLAPPRQLTLSRLPDRVHITFVATPGDACVLQYAPDLDGSPWLDIAVLAGTGASQTIADTDPARLAAPRGYYRVKVSRSP